ncbi:TonB-dependent receptor [Sphingomonas yantingensis]|uniref:Iron complex outermembrane receptor protein n=1 Tax=Sphingomonas yantingensis TaxID=1241761 RepID=A0A7W9AS82_9SPHN|nr:TonB-dependent receptor [Sphingomonas yantingensis]MBB5699633.1 iron complex outermembrane receptor protein [Sphingomonas yantingensis]
MSLAVLKGVLLLAASPQVFAAAEPPRVPVPVASSATAEEGKEPEAQQGGDITVTARRREENVQQVPIAVSVVSGATLDAQGTYNISRLTQLTPTLQFYSQNPRNTFINIRGIGAPFGLTNDGFEQGVGIYIDDVYYNRIASATLDFVDVERIETLRGPQGTLYGKNTTAGAINITTRAPSFDFEGKAEVSVGNLDFKQGKVSVSGPLSENLATRLSATVTDRRGTLYNTRTGQYIQSQDSVGVRGSLLWKVKPDLDITLSGDWNLQDPICCAFSYGSYGPTQRVANRQYPALVSYFPGYAVPSTNPYDRLTDVDAQLRARNEHGGLSARLVWEIDGANTLTSITAWRYWDWQPANDRDYTGLPVYTKVNNPTKQDQYTQELRYNHQGNGFDLTLGLFGFHQKIRTSGIQETGTAASKWLLNPTSALSNNPAVLNNVLALNDIRLDNTSVAAFGKLNWEVTDRFTVSPGIRINYDKKDGLYNSVVTGTASNGTRQVVSAVPGSPSYNDPWTAAQRGIQASQFFEPKFSAWNASYDLNLRYEVARDINVYATYARAFKTGGINLNGVPADANGAPILAAATIKPEKVDHFEAGIKTQFWDRRATFNLTGFWTDIKDFQANVSNGQFGTVRGYLANAEKVRSRGFEADFSVRPSARFNAYASGAFTDAEYVKFCDAPPPPELSGGTTLPATGPCTFSGTVSAPGTSGGNSPPFVDASGQDLPGVSKWAFSWGAEANKEGRLFGEGGQFYVGYDGSYRSDWSSNPTPSIYTQVEGYSIHNFRAGFRTGKFDLFGWIRNAFDQDYIDLLLAGTGGNTGLIAAQVGDPRTFGGTVKLNF